MSGLLLDFTTMRRNMVDCQVRPADVTDLRVIEALLSVPREQYLPPELQGEAYLDRDLPLSTRGPRRYLMKPAVIGRLLQAAGIAPTHRVLVVGCGTGYLAAVTSRLAGTVTALESDEALAQLASAKFAMGGTSNVTVVTGQLDAGAPANAPYDVIVLAGAAEDIPQSLCRQLTPAGCMVGVFGSGPQRAMLVRHSHNDYGSRVLFDAGAPILPEFARVAAFSF